jgi:hypothetical protein
VENDDEDDCEAAADKKRSNNHKYNNNMCFATLLVNGRTRTYLELRKLAFELQELASKLQQDE